MAASTVAPEKRVRDRKQLLERFYYVNMMYAVSYARTS